MKRRKIIMLLLAALVAATGLTVVAVAAAQNGLPAAAGEQDAPVAAPAGAISPGQAAQTAEGATGQASSGVELDDENGTVVYEVQAGGSEVAVDAVTGKVLKVESGNGNEGGAELQNAGEAENDSRDNDSQEVDNGSTGQH